MAPDLVRRDDGGVRETRVASVGELIEFPNASVRVLGMSYDSYHEGSCAGSGRIYALLRMEVWVRDYPKYKLGWAGNDFVLSWSLQDGRELFGEHFTTGESTHVEP